MAIEKGSRQVGLANMLRMPAHRAARGCPIPAKPSAMHLSICGYNTPLPCLHDAPTQTSGFG
jgi:hypothetical protein